MDEKLKKETKELYKSATKLEKENYDVWINEPSSQGHGYKVILEDTWIEVWLSAMVTSPSKTVITLYKKNEESPNILDSFMCKELAKRQTLDLKKVYGLVKELIGQKLNCSNIHYIEIRRQGGTLAIVKVKAKNYKEAENLALRALHYNDDIDEISEDEVKSRIESGEIDYVMDEYGDEVVED